MTFPCLNLWLPGDVAPFDRPTLIKSPSGKMRGYYAARKSKNGGRDRKDYGVWKEQVGRSLNLWKKRTPDWLTRFPPSYRHKSKPSLSNVILLIRFHGSLHGRADGANGVKAIEDALVNADILCDDNVTRLSSEAWEFTRDLENGKKGTRIIIVPNQFGSLIDSILQSFLI